MYELILEEYSADVCMIYITSNKRPLLSLFLVPYYFTTMSILAKFIQLQIALTVVVYRTDVEDIPLQGRTSKYNSILHWITYQTHTIYNLSNHVTCKECWYTNSLKNNVPRYSKY